MALVTLTLLALVPVLIYVFLVWNFDFWRKRGVRSPKAVPLLGTFPNLIRQKQHFADDLKQIYDQYKASDNYLGVFLMRTPQLLVLDPKLAHQIFVGAFKHFQDNDVDGKKDPLIANNPFVLAGDKWREQRALVSPGMTGSRIKVAYSVMQQVCHDFCTYIEQQIETKPPNGINGKLLALRFTSENVLDCVLGIKAKSFTSNPLPVADNVRMFSDDNTVFLIYSLMSGICPSFVKIYKAKFMPQKCENFFLDLMRQAFTMRADNRVDRLDFMNHLLTLKAKKELSDIELYSHSMTFLIDGLDTTATAIAHCLLLLARDPHIQQKLREEILANADDHGELSFDKLNDLPYLDACLHESLRIFPPGLWASKSCTEPYEFTNKDGRKLQLCVGDTLMIPIYGYHSDPEYYPEPEQFKPERFLPESGGVKKYRDMGVFLGFGDGPRQCLGMRFALVQSKAAISAILKSFIVKVNPKTLKKNQLDPKAFLAQQNGGVWLDFEKYR